MTKHLELTKRKFAEVADHQEGKGILKYGKPLDPLDNYDWLEMEFEELVDAAKYNRAEKEKRNTAINKIWNIVDQECNTESKLEIGHWLNLLEGKL